MARYVRPVYATAFSLLSEPLDELAHGLYADSEVGELTTEAGLASLGRGNPASLVSRGSLDELAHQAGVADTDARRFRMLIELDGTIPHEEDDWIGGRIALGEAILRVSARDGRCAITTQDPDTGARDFDTLRAIIRYRGVMPDKSGAPKAMFGVLADVELPGRVRLGDAVQVLDRAP